MATQGKAKLWLVVLMSILALMAIGAANYLRQHPHDSPQQTQSAPTSSSPVPDSAQKQESTSRNAPDDNSVVKVFFSKHPDSDTDASKTFPIEYPVKTSALASYAIEQLILGPNADLASRDYFSMVKLEGESVCDNKNFSLDIVRGTAILKFCRRFMASGAVSDGQAKSEITDTLKQFPTVSKVVILNAEGNCLFDLSGQNQCLK